MPGRSQKAQALATRRAPSFEDHVAVRVVRIAEILERLAQRAIEPRWGLRNTDLRILNLLDGEASLPVSVVSRRAHVDKAWISRSIRQLAKRGLVELGQDRDDARLSLVSLTVRGRTLLDEIRPTVLLYERRLL